MANQKGAVIFQGSRAVSASLFGVSNWYWPWDASRIEPDTSTYSIVRYCNVNGNANFNLAWSKIEQVQGTRVWTDLDIWVNAHFAKGKDMLLEIGRPPTWATTGGVDNKAPLNMADFANWVTAVGGRYNGKIKYWIIRNEPTFSGTTSEYVDTTAKYAEMARIASQILKSINPENKIVGPETSSCGYLAWASFTAPALTASAVGYDAGFGTGAGTTLLDWIDILSLHPYFTYPLKADLTFDQLRMDLEKTMQMAQQYAPGKPIWMSEYMAIANDGIPVASTEYAVVWRQMCMCIALDFQKFINFGWGGSSAIWNQNNPTGVAARQWWKDAVTFLTGSPVVRIEVLERGRILVTRQDGQQMSDSY